MNIKAIVIVIFAAAWLVCSTSYADRKACTQDAVHCAYINGLKSDDPAFGKYIKIDYQGQTPTVQCLNYAAAIQIPPSRVTQFPIGKEISVSYAICNSLAGKLCEPLGDDIFQINHLLGIAMSEPRYYPINLPESIYQNYQTCDASQAKPFSPF